MFSHLGGRTGENPWQHSSLCGQIWICGSEPASQSSGHEHLSKPVVRNALNLLEIYMGDKSLNMRNSPNNFNLWGVQTYGDATV